MSARVVRLARAQPSSEEAVEPSRNETDTLDQRERVMRTALRQCSACVRRPGASFDLLYRARALLELMQWVCLDRFRVEARGSEERRRLANLLLEITHELDEVEARQR
jgi:hypothetical protein